MRKHESFVEAICSILEKNHTLPASESNELKALFKNNSQDTFDDFLLSEGLIEKGTLLQALSTYYKVPSFDAVGYFFKHELLLLFPKLFLLENTLIPLSVDDEAIMIVITNNPADESLLPKIGEYVSYDIQFMVGLSQDIIDSIEEFYDEAVTVVNEDSDIHDEERERHEAEEIETIDTEE